MNIHIHASVLVLLSAVLCVCLYMTGWLKEVISSQVFRKLIELTQAFWIRGFLSWALFRLSPYQ